MERLSSAKPPFPFSSPASRDLFGEVFVSIFDAVSRWAEPAALFSDTHDAIQAKDVLTTLSPNLITAVSCRLLFDILQECPISARKAQARVGSAIELEWRFHWFRKKGLLVRGSTFSHARISRWDRSSQLRLCNNLELSALESHVKSSIGLVLLTLWQESTGLFTFERDPGGQRVLIPAPGILEWMRKQEAHGVQFAPVYTPTERIPRPWSCLWGGGYDDERKILRPLVKVASHSAAILKELNGASMPDVYESVNALQATGWASHYGVLGVLKNLWASGEPRLLPPKEPTPLPRLHRSMPPTEKRAVLLERGRVRRQNATHLSRGIRITRLLWIADKIPGRTFYFPHQTDFRGRLYPLPVLLTPQGGDLPRGVLRFADNVRLTHSGWRSFAVHGANLYGFSKKSIDERVDWVHEHESEILQVAQDPQTNRKLWVRAEEPWQFLQFCFEWKHARETGDTATCCWMDSTSNAFQILALLLRDEELAEATNLIECDTPRDLYQEIAAEVTHALSTEGSSYARRWLGFFGENIPRSFVKKPAIALPFGISESSIRERLLRGYFDRLDQGYPDVFASSERHDALGVLCAAVCAVLRSRFASTLRYTSWIQECASILGKRHVHAAWTAPSGFRVFQHYEKSRFQWIRRLHLQGDSLLGWRMNRRRGQVDRAASRRSIAANFIHSLDAAVLARTIRKSQEEGVHQLASVHDCYGTHPNDISTIHRVLRSSYYDIFSVDWLHRLHQDLQSQVPNTPLPNPPERGSFRVAQVESALYMAS